MGTVRDLITGSMRLIGAIATGETPSASELSDGLTALNDMIDSWSNENFLVFAKTIEFFPLTPGQASFTIGTGGDFDTIRPMKIETATLQVQQTPLLELPMKIINKDEFAAIRVKSTESPIPVWLYDDGSFPLKNLYLWPVPMVANKLGLYSWKQLSEFSSLNDEIDLPPGYNKALRYGLALEIAPEYGKPLDPTIVTQFKDSRSNIKRMNIKPEYLSCDAGVLNDPWGFNWLTGEYK
jgi:hypothetical protein